MAAKTLLRVASLTCAGAASARLTVAVETPARRATSKMVTARGGSGLDGRSWLISLGFFFLPCLNLQGCAIRKRCSAAAHGIGVRKQWKTLFPGKSPNAIDIGAAWNRIDVND